MTTVIDLISSSPEAARLPSPPPPPQSAQSALPQGVEILSDDFDTTWESSGAVLSRSNGNKRRRLTKSPSPRRDSLEPPNRTSSRAARLSQHVPSSDDPFASSPKRSSPKQSSPKCRPTTLVASPRAKTSTAARPLPVESSDPFASSPKRHSPKPPSPRRVSPGSAEPIGPRSMKDTTASARFLPGEDSDPFASSPLPVAQAKPASRARTESTTSSRRQGMEGISSPAPPGTSAKTSRQQWDPISSSAPEASGAAGGGALGASHTMAIDIDSESDDELPDLQTIAASQQMFPPTRSPIRRSRSDVISSTTGKAKTAKKPRATSAVTAAFKEAERERKRQERQLAKEMKAQEKQRAAALTEANKMRDKKASAQEMIVELPSGLRPEIRTQTETILEGLMVSYTTWESSQGIIRWRRKVTTRFNEDLGLWEPTPQKIVPENHVAVIVTAEEFIALAKEGAGEHVAQMRAAFPSQRLLYILEGLTPWMKKNRNARNRQFTSGVRSQEGSTRIAAGRRRNAAAEYISEEVVEDALMELQVMHEDILIHHTAVPLETAQWIAIFTQHISTIPYKKRKDQADVGFCMESGQVKTGDDARDTYVRVLQEIARVTAPIAYGIAAQFGTITELVNGLEKGGPLTLEATQKTVNKEGTLSDRTVGQAVSRRMHKVFTGQDPSSTEV